MSFSSQKGEFDRFFNRLDRPVEESRPDRQPDRCRLTRPVSISAVQYSHCQQICAGKDKAKIRTIKKEKGKRVGKRISYHLVLCYWLDKQERQSP